MEYNTISNLLKIYEQEIVPHVKNKNQLLKFERHKMENIVQIQKNFENPNYVIKNYHIFLIFEPKCRVIMSMRIHDKIMNHFFTRYVLEPKLEKFLDSRNIATRKNMGSEYGIRLIKKYMNCLKKYSNFYILKLDIKKYFYSIDHQKLKHMVKPFLTNEEFSFFCKTLDSTNKDYINKSILKLQKHDSLPIYSYDKGLPIGNLSSQFLSIYYLNELDHFIVHDLHLKYYVRYMDDFIIMSNDKEYLKMCFHKITERLHHDYLLEWNEKKTKIVNAKDGFVFLGYHFHINENKIIIKLRQQTLKKMKKGIKVNRTYLKNNSISFEHYFSSIQNYSHSYKYGNKKRIYEYIESNG